MLTDRVVFSAAYLVAVQVTLSTVYRADWVKVLMLRFTALSRKMASQSHTLERSSRFVVVYFRGNCNFMPVLISLRFLCTDSIFLLTSCDEIRERLKS